MSIRGVAYNTGTRRWRASLSGYGRRGYIGEYATEAEAVAARRAAEVALHGAEHADPDPQVDGDLARIPLIGRDGALRGWAVIDATDLGLVEGPSWCLSVSGYAVARVAGRIVYLHRIILPGEGVADHISGDKLDCRRANLRLCSQTANARNAAAKGAKSGFKGVVQTRGGRFSARITINRRYLGLGTFATAEAAARAYDLAAAEHFGAFARPNFPVIKTPAESAGVDIHVGPYDGALA